MAAIDLGRLRFYHQGAYSGGTTYEMNDVVTYGGKSYVYINTTNTSGNLPTNATYWSKMAEGLASRGAWAANTAYYPGDIVVSGGSTYQVLLAHTSGNFLHVDIAANKLSSFVSGFDWKGDWAGNTAYKVDDVVFVDGNAYIATAEFTSNATTFATDIANWDLFSQGGTGEIPSQSGNANKVLKTDGTDVSWTNALSIVSATLSGQLTANTVVSNVITSNANIFVATNVLVGANAGAFANTLTNPTLVVQSNAVDYSQIAFRNLGTNANSSTDIIAYADAGDDDSGWIDMGITSSNFSDESFTITADHDGYIFLEAPANTAGNGNLVLATGGNGQQNKIVFAAGGLSSNDTQMVITPNTSVAINIATNSTSATTGALTVAGGLGVGGNVYINGNTNIVGTITVGGGAFESNNLTVSDPIVFMGNTNTGDTFDLGFAGKFDDGAVKYAGLLRDASDSGKFKLFTNLTSAPTSTANFAAAANASLILGNLEASGNATISGNTTVSTNLTVTGNATVSTDLAVTGNLSVSGQLLVNELAEGAASGTITSNLLTVAYSNTLVSYVSSPSANFTVNLTGVPTTNDRVITFTVLVTQGATGYIPSAFQIDGSAQTIKWGGGSAPTPTSSSGKIDIFSFTLLRNSSSAWVVFGAGNLNF
jgi:cytoskeletal protein CcmA (bactofilin family)